MAPSSPPARSARGPIRAAKIVKLTAEAGRAAFAWIGGEIVKDLPEVSTAGAVLPAGALEALQRSPLVEYVEPDLPRYLLGEAAGPVDVGLEGGPADGGVLRDGHMRGERRASEGAVAVAQGDGPKSLAAHRGVDQAAVGEERLGWSGLRTVRG